MTNVRHCQAHGEFHESESGCPECQDTERMAAGFGAALEITEGIVDGKEQEERDRASLAAFEAAKAANLLEREQNEEQREQEAVEAKARAEPVASVKAQIEAQRKVERDMRIVYEFAREGLQKKEADLIWRIREVESQRRGYLTDVKESCLRAEAAEQDAKRYRWLRDNNLAECPNCVSEWKCNGPHITGGPELDAAIDAAMHKEEQP